MSLDDAVGSNSDLNSSVDSIIASLRAAGTQRQRERVLNRGVPEAHILGASKGVVNKLAKAQGKNQALAELLWASSFHEARLIAILTAEPRVVSNKRLKQWVNDLWSWDITDQFARYLLPYVVNPDEILRYCLTSDCVFTKRLAFAGIACYVLKHPDLSRAQIEMYLAWVRQGAEDKRHPVRKAVVWALVEIGKLNDAWQNEAIVFAAELIEQTGNIAWVGRHALKELEALVVVPERRRLISSNATTARKKPDNC